MQEIPLKIKIILIIRKIIFLTIGAIIAAGAIEGFLAPNNIIDGGVVGVSMIINHLIPKLNLGLLVAVINVPFICIAFHKMGKRFVFQTFYAIAVFATALNFFHKYFVTNDLLLATVFGGIILGIGVGLILKNEGSLDGTEILSLAISKKIGLSVGEFIMGLNIFIYSAAGIAYKSWETAMYSMLTYYIASKVIDIVLEGLNSSKSVRIISDKAYEIGEALIEKLDIGITYLNGIGGYSKTKKTMIYCIISRIEMANMKEIIKEIDPSAFISVVDVYEAYGKRLAKKIDKM